MGQGRSSGASERRGSTASDKQIWRAVAEERFVRFHSFSDYPPVDGWVMGLDDYHYVVAQGDGSVLLVHKACPVVTITGNTLADQTPAVQKRVRSLTGPFRLWVEREFFNRSA